MNKLRNLFVTAAVVLGLGTSSQDIIAQTSNNIHDTITLTSRPFHSPTEQGFIQWRFLNNAGISVTFNEGDSFLFDEERKTLDLGKQTPIHNIPQIIHAISWEEKESYASYTQALDILLRYYNSLDLSWTATIDRASIEQYLWIIPTDSTTIADEWNLHVASSKIDSIQMLIAPELYSMFAKNAFEIGAKNLTWLSGLKDTIQRDNIVEKYKKKQTIDDQTIYAKAAIKKLLLGIDKTQLRKNTSAWQKDFFLESTANNILQTNDIACVWLSTIVHEFCVDMWLHHEAIIHKNHVAIIIYFPDGSTLFCDPLEDWDSGLQEMYLEKVDYHGSHIVVQSDSYLVLTDDADKVLMSTIAFNDSYRMINIDDKKIAQTKIMLLKKALSFQDKNFVAYAALADLLYRMEEFEDAYVYSKKAVELMPHDKQYLKNHLNILVQLPSNQDINKEKYTTMEKINSLK